MAKKIIIFLLILLFSFPVQASVQERLSGRILLQVEENGEAWYVYPPTMTRYFLGRPSDAFSIMRQLSLGISNRDFQRVRQDTPDRLLGRILLKVEDRGRAYYIDPATKDFHYLGRPSDAFRIMRELGLGITNADLLLIPIAEPEFKRFGPDEFEELFNEASLPNTQELASAPAITGNREADQRIVSLAEEKGYELQPVPGSDELAPLGNELVQSLARRDWLVMEEKTHESNINLGVVSAYRSLESQRQIFLDALEAEGEQRLGRPYTENEIAGGEADEAILSILETISIPGFSKHHSGYSLDLVDITSNLPFTRFGETRGYDWISADNFLNAKRYGFIPSYPRGATDIGPRQEPWEYVWVGKDRLLK